MQHAARVWRVTFDAALGDVPSLLVDTGGGGTQFNEAVGAHGHLKGTSPFANVTEAQKGGLPRWVSVGDGRLAAGRPHYARVAAYTHAADAWSEPAVAALTAAPADVAPTPPVAPKVSVAGPTSLAVSWAAPDDDGGAPVTHYLVQYDLDESFDDSTGFARVPVEDLEHDQGRYAHVLEALTTGTAYYVRVLAHNAAGYSEPRMAASRADAPVYRIDVGKGSTDFMLHVSARGNSESTAAIAAGATASDVAAAIMDLTELECGAVLVRRWDSSDYASTANMGDVYDPVDTKFGYEVEFGGDRDAALEISNYQARYGQKADPKFDGINVTLAAAPAADGYAIKPAYREPSAPTRVKLFSVSRTNLGVAWAPPVLSGGHKVEKYLVEWDSNPEFSTISDLGAGFASVPSTTAGQVAVNASAARGLTVLSDHQFQIRGLTPGRSYWVRVSAWNAKGYGDARVSTPASAQPADQLLGPPVNASASVSPGEYPDRLRVVFNQPRVDLNGFAQTTHGGNEPAKAGNYRIEWSESSSFPDDATHSYDWRALQGDDVDLECEGYGADGVSGYVGAGVPCSFELGAEVQSVRVYSEGSEPLTGGSYKLLYAGPSSPRTRLVVNPGTSRAEFVNVSDLGDNYAYGGDVLTKGSFVRIGGVDGKLYGINQTSGFQEDALSDRGGNVTLHTAFTLDQGAHVDAHTGKMVVDAYVVAPPTTCLLPTLKSARPCRTGSATEGTLSGSCWRSASMQTQTSCAAREKPRSTALDRPRPADRGRVSRRTA